MAQGTGQPHGRRSSGGLLSVSQFAELAHTTRRTLIFYDRHGLFHPAKVTQNGYRYYDYDQLYELNFILGLRDLGLSLEEIGSFVGAQADMESSSILDRKIDDLRARTRQQIIHLEQVERTIEQRLRRHTEPREQAPLYRPFVEELPATYFWVSDFESDCTPEEVARLYSDFYARLDPMAVTNGTRSGFLTTLEGMDPEQYPSAGFRVVKERSEADGNRNLPIMVRPAGRYMICRVENSLAHIQQGLSALRSFADKHGYAFDDNLWQINIGTHAQANGFTATGFLEYRVTGSHDTV